MTDYYSGFPRIRNHFFRYNLLFSNNSLLFYSLFCMKIEIGFLYKGDFLFAGTRCTSFGRQIRYTYPLPQCFINYLMWSTNRRSPLKESVEGLTHFRSHLFKFLSTVGSISFNFFPVEVQFLKFTPILNQIRLICLL